MPLQTWESGKRAIRRTAWRERGRDFFRELMKRLSVFEKKSMDGRGTNRRDGRKNGNTDAKSRKRICRDSASSRIAQPRKVRLAQAQEIMGCADWDAFWRRDSALGGDEGLVRGWNERIVMKEAGAQKTR